MSVKTKSPQIAVLLTDFGRYVATYVGSNGECFGTPWEADTPEEAVDALLRSEQPEE
jgi:hypothetical protein